MWQRTGFFIMICILRRLITDNKVEPYTEHRQKYEVDQMKNFTGKSACKGVAIGRAFVLTGHDNDVRKWHIDDTEKEKKRFFHAKSISISQLNDIYEKAVAGTGKENAQIFKAHILIMEDAEFVNSVINLIEEQSVNAEYAIKAVADRYEGIFASMEDSYMRERAADIRDIAGRLMENLSGQGRVSDSVEGQVILCAEELSPSETVQLDKEHVVAFVTAYGSLNSHMAILARSMNIPAIIGVGQDFLHEISNGDRLAVDGYTGRIWIAPDEETIERIENKKREDEQKKALLDELKGKENITLDGRTIDIFANIGSVKQLKDALDVGAGGIGLFRSEFLYLESSDYPTEEQQFTVYKKVLQSMKEKKVIIRTLDIGADKQVSYFHLEKEENPALGYRAIRICLTRPELFKTQLRALYRASVFGKLGIMFPMIISVTEVEKIKVICEEVKKELSEENIPYSEQVELGIMIETPAAAIISDRLAKMVDFFSVGTNDLTQYTLACDRQNAAIEQFADTHHEAVLRLIELAAKNAHENGVWIGICGELAADTSLTETFLRMGIDELSVSPVFLLQVRDAVRKITLL